MAFVQEKIWCTTGHRTEADATKRLHRRECARQLVVLAKEKGAILLIGGARGWDWEVMEEAFAQEIRYKLYLPFMDRMEIIPDNYIGKALEVCYAFPEYNVRGYHLRNMDMVDESSIVHAYWDGRKCWEEKGKRKCSGTWNCIKYASEKKVKIINWYKVKLKTDH